MKNHIRTRRDEVMDHSHICDITGDKNMHRSFPNLICYILFIKLSLLSVKCDDYLKFSNEVI